MNKEKPILFNTEMVQAILEGRKTQTRRIIKPQPAYSKFGGYVIASGDKREIGKAMFANSFPVMNGADYIKPPYQVGDILWVRETWTTIDNFKNYADVEMDKNIKYLYKCDDNGKEHVFIDVGVNKWKPSIHMPKEAARIFLKVTDVRVERLQDITDKDVLKEGTNVIVSGYDRNDYEFCFMNLWDGTCNKEEYRWSYNPWVWVIEFEKLEGYNE